MRDSPLRVGFCAASFRAGMKGKVPGIDPRFALGPASPDPSLPFGKRVFARSELGAYAAVIG